MVFQNRWTRNVGYRLIDDFWATRTGSQMDKIGWIEALVYRPIVTFHTHPIGPRWPANIGPSDTDVKTFMRRYPRTGEYHIVVNESRVYTISPSGTTCQIGWTPSAIAR
jgi:proteasome lid subunit RPN8/RPN11